MLVAAVLLGCNAVHAWASRVPVSEAVALAALFGSAAVLVIGLGFALRALPAPTPKWIIVVVVIVSALCWGVAVATAISISRARSSTFRCFETAGRLMAKGSASSLTGASPSTRRARIARRVGSASAAKVALSWSLGTVAVVT